MLVFYVVIAIALTPICLAQDPKWIHEAPELSPSVIKYIEKKISAVKQEVSHRESLHSKMFPDFAVSGYCHKRMHFMTFKLPIESFLSHKKKL